MRDTWLGETPIVSRQQPLEHNLTVGHHDGPEGSGIHLALRLPVIRHHDIVVVGQLVEIEAKKHDEDRHTPGLQELHGRHALPDELDGDDADSGDDPNTCRRGNLNAGIVHEIENEVDRVDEGSHPRSAGAAVSGTS